MTTTRLGMLVWLWVPLAGACSDAVQGLDGSLVCAQPQPTCDGPSSPGCCTQVSACGVCYGDGLTQTECRAGQWVCGEGRQLLSACERTWSPYADAGPFPSCDGGALAPDAEVDAGIVAPVDAGPPPACEQDGISHWPGITFGDGCNFCYCDCEGDVCQRRCTAAGCGADVGTAPSELFPRCRTHQDCAPDVDGGVARAVCLYDPGCTEPLGTCVLVQSMCSRTRPPTPADGGAPGFCGCDGVTYSGMCPTVPYERPGACGD